MITIDRITREASRALREAMVPMTQSELIQRQLDQATRLRGMTDDEMAQRYGDGLMNAYRPDGDGEDSP